MADCWKADALPLVLELSHGSHMRSVGHLIVTVGTSLPLGDSASMHSPQTIKAPLVLCRRCRQIETFLGHRGVTSTLALFSSTLLHWPRSLSFQYSSHSLYCRSLVGRALRK
jgi:hypothetical protein